MADGIVVTTTGGTVTVAADEIGATQVQRVKVQSGVDGTATDVSSSNPMPVSAVQSGTWSTSAVQSGTWNSRLQDGSGNALTSSVRGAASDHQALDVAQASSLTFITVSAGSGTRYFGATTAASSYAVNVLASSVLPAGTVDTLGYSWWTAGWIAVGSALGSPSIEVSHDGVNWFNPYYEYTASGSQPAVAPVSGSLSNLWGVTYTYTGPLLFRYMRLKTTGTVTGTYTMQIAMTPAALSKQILQVVGATVTSDLNSPISGGVLETIGYNYGYYGGVANQWQRIRVSNIIKSVAATASGNTAVWTPTSGLKFRVMKYQIEVTADAATSGGADVDIVLQDASTSIGAGASVYCPAVAGTSFGNGYTTTWRDLGNGYVSTTINNVLNVNLSAALSSGKVRVNVAGVEE